MERASHDGVRDPRSGRASDWLLPCHAVVTPGWRSTLAFTGGGTRAWARPRFTCLIVRRQNGCGPCCPAQLEMLVSAFFPQEPRRPLFSTKALVLIVSDGVLDLRLSVGLHLTRLRAWSFCLFGNSARLASRRPAVCYVRIPLILESGINTDFGAALRLELRTSQPAAPGNRPKIRNTVGNEGPTNPDGPELPLPGLEEAESLLQLLPSFSPR